MSYTNQGPIDPNSKKTYLAVNGKRVYTGETFEASDEDVRELRNSFDITSNEDNDQASVESSDSVEEKAPQIFVEEEETTNFIAPDYEGESDSRPAFEADSIETNESGVNYFDSPEIAINSKGVK